MAKSKHEKPLIFITGIVQYAFKDESYSLGPLPGAFLFGIKLNTIFVLSFEYG